MDSNKEMNSSGNVDVDKTRKANIKIGLVDSDSVRGQLGSTNNRKKNNELCRSLAEVAYDQKRDSVGYIVQVCGLDKDFDVTQSWTYEYGELAMINQEKNNQLETAAIWNLHLAPEETVATSLLHWLHKQDSGPLSKIILKFPKDLSKEERAKIHRGCEKFPNIISRSDGTGLNRQLCVARKNVALPRSITATNKHNKEAEKIWNWAQEDFSFPCSQYSKGEIEEIIATNSMSEYPNLFRMVELRQNKEKTIASFWKCCTLRETKIDDVEGMLQKYPWLIHHRDFYSGELPLTQASYENFCSQIFRVLLDNGADYKSLSRKNGLSCIEICKLRKNKDAIKAIKRRQRQEERFIKLVDSGALNDDIDSQTGFLKFD